MFVAYNIPPHSLHPALFEDVYLDSERYGAYLYYVACDEAAVMQTGYKQSSLASLNQEENICLEGARVRRSDCTMVHAVSVSFDKETLEYAQSVVNDDRMDKYHGFNELARPSGVNNKSIEELMSLASELSRKPILMDKGENWASLAVLSNNNRQSKFQFIKVVDGRAIEVLALCRNLDTAVVGDVINPWNKLIAKYNNIPANVF